MGVHVERLDSLKTLIKRHGVLQTISYDSAQGLIQEYLDPENLVVHVLSERIPLDQLWE